MLPRMGGCCYRSRNNVALKRAAGKGGYLEFKEEWFDVDNDETPDEAIAAETAFMETCCLVFRDASIHQPPVYEIRPEVFYSCSFGWIVCA